MYTTFKIPKRNGGARIIEAPDEELKSRQRDLLPLFYSYPLNSISHGFRRNKSPKTNAALHIGAKIIVRLDICDFFTSITRPKVLFTFRRLGIDNADDLADLVTYNNHLPQGAPTSPVVSNLCCVELDNRIEALQIPHGCTVTRYADDLTFSSDYNFQLPEIIPIVRNILLGHDFQLNSKKTRVFRKHNRLFVTGVVVNLKTNVPRDKRRQLRAELHKLKGQIISNNYYSQLRGKIEWIKFLNPQQGQKFIEQLHEIRRSDN